MHKQVYTYANIQIHNDTQLLIDSYANIQNNNKHIYSYTIIQLHEYTNIHVYEHTHTDMYLYTYTVIGKSPNLQIYTQK